MGRLDVAALAIPDGKTKLLLRTQEGNPIDFNQIGRQRPLRNGQIGHAPNIGFGLKTVKIPCVLTRGEGVINRISMRKHLILFLGLGIALLGIIIGFVLTARFDWTNPVKAV